VHRPQVLVFRAWTLESKEVEIEADELLARVAQHEIDHLDGIEYVQRLTGGDRSRVYERLRKAGVNVAWVPPLS
jgi:peptide deformylase